MAIGGPLFARELTTLPRHPRTFGLRAGYVAALCILIYTGAQTTFGLSSLLTPGDLAEFGETIFQVVATVQLALVIGMSLVFAAGNVAQEKDSRTLILLLMTDLRASELVVGKSLASVLPVISMIVASIPVLLGLTLLGGVTPAQAMWVELICLAACLAAAAWGTLVAYWREKTFQTLAISFLGAGLFLGMAEVIASWPGLGDGPRQLVGSFNPFRALGQVLNPLTETASGNQWLKQGGGVLALWGIAIVLWTWTCLRVRIWNPSRFMYTQIDDQPADTEETAAPVAATRRTGRQIWSTPVLWREICTQAYGRKVGLIKLAYGIVALLSLFWLSRQSADAPLVFGALSGQSIVFSLLAVVTLVLVNAQSVTALTSERDGHTLELLLVTEVTAQEFVYGKLAGVLFNTKELILIPLLWAAVALFQGSLSPGLFFSMVVSDLTLVLFVAMLGLHAGFSYSASRAAIINSQGTVFFLFIGILICMMLIVEARTSFILQLIPFLVFILGGSLGLWMSLTHKNPSPALTMCAWGLPFLTFYAIVSFLLGDIAAVCLAIVAAYGFTTLAMLIPAVSAFDVALGRTTIDRG